MLEIALPLLADLALGTLTFLGHLCLVGFLLAVTIEAWSRLCALREKAQEDRLAKAFKDIYSALGYSIEDAECRAVIRARRSARILRRSSGA